MEDVDKESNVEEEILLNLNFIKKLILHLKARYIKGFVPVKISIVIVIKDSINISNTSIFF